MVKWIMEVPHGYILFGFSLLLTSKPGSPFFFWLFCFLTCATASAQSDYLTSPNKKKS